MSDYTRVGHDSAFSFLDLVDSFVVGRFRRAGVKMGVVRAAYSQLKEDLGTSHPFAHSSLYTDGKTIIVQTAEKIRNELFYDAVSKQQFFDELAGGLERIDYRPDTGLAARWRVADGVLIDPELNFGKPVVAQTGTSTSIDSGSRRSASPIKKAAK